MFSPAPASSFMGPASSFMGQHHQQHHHPIPRHINPYPIQQQPKPPPNVTYSIPVQKQYAGVIIGKSGKTIQGIEREFNVKANLNKGSPLDFFTVEGSEIWVNRAVVKIQQMLLKAMMRPCEENQKQKAQHYVDKSITETERIRKMIATVGGEDSESEDSESECVKWGDQ